MSIEPILCVIPARGGSKGLPGKNLKLLCGFPLIAHSIMCAKMVKSLDRIIVSTDDDKIAEVTRQYKADVPFKRPQELATDTAGMISVLQHALIEMEKIDGKRYESILLLDPTSPGRTPEDIEKAVSLLKKNEKADGVVGVSEPEFNPYWHCVIERDGVMEPLIKGASRFARRQDVPKVFRINASLYLWKRDFILSEKAIKWIEEGRHLMVEIPERRAIHIDHKEDFEKAEVFLKEGYVELPWIKE
jgi:CMP-N,N'-diacetyllegionaminic acid synthase